MMRLYKGHGPPGTVGFSGAYIARGKQAVFIWLQVIYIYLAIINLLIDVLTLSEDSIHCFRLLSQVRDVPRNMVRITAYIGKRVKV